MSGMPVPVTYMPACTVLALVVVVTLQLPITVVTDANEPAVCPRVVTLNVVAVVLL